MTPRPPLAVLCFTSGKGGTGKSILSSNLAVHCAAEGRRVVVVDADLGLGNQHILMGVQPLRTIADVLEDGADLLAVTQEGPAGVRLAAGTSGRSDMADLHPTRAARLILAIEALAGRTDLVIVDTGAGIGRATLAFLYGLRDIVVVTTPDLTAMTDGYAVIKNVARNNSAARVALIVNRAASAVDGLEVFRRIDLVSRRFLLRPLRYLGHVLDDARVKASIAARIPILLNQPASPAAACLRGIGRSMLLEIGKPRAATSGAKDGARPAPVLHDGGPACA